MSQVLVTESYLQDTGDAIREKNGLSEASYLPSEFADAIRAIPTGQAPVLETLTATENGTYAPSAGYNGFSAVNVNVKKLSFEASAVMRGVLPSRTATATFNLSALVWTSQAAKVTE